MPRASKLATSKVGELSAVPPASFTDAMFRIYATGVGKDWYASKEFKMFIAGAKFMAAYSAARGERVCDSLQHMVEFEGRAK